jgi:FemAB-related protein (PEP-CTERM system-associated)
MEVSNLDLSSPACAEFVEQMPEAKLCHMPAWTAMVENAFGHQGYYLVARENGRVCGVLPLVRVRSRLFGNRLVSQPFSDYGGPLAESTEALEALYRSAVEIAEECRCESLELRNTASLPYELHLRDDKISMCLPLMPEAADVWKGLRHKTRNRVRKAERAGFTVVSGGQELLDEFYRAWTIRMRELGTPCYPRRLFSSIMETFPAESRIFLAMVGGVTAAVLFAYTFNGRVQCSWGAALRGYDEAGPNYILNWKAIEYYCAQGMSVYDFGRSTIGSGQHTFKERWGATPLNLCWQYWTPPGKGLHLVKPDDPKYRKKTEMWKRLPLRVTRFLGPRISCSLP